MSQGYSVILTRCMLISGIGLLSGVAFTLPPIVPLTLGILPLFWYHLGYLRLHAGEGISQPAVDSVYYFGFLITIGALGATALRLGIYGVEGSFSNVAMQFGLGLFATGYAVWARIQLTASSTLLDEANLEEAMNRYVERSRELVANVEMASSSFRAYAETVMVSSQEFTRRVHEDTNTEIKQAAETFRDAILSMTEEGRLAVQALRAVVNDVTFGSEREELKRSVASMMKTVTKLTGTLEELRTSSLAGASSVGQFASDLASVGDRAQEAAGRLGELGDQNGVLTKILAAVQDCRIKFDELNLSVDVAGASVTRFSDNVSTSAATADEFGSQTSKAVSSMREIASVSAKVSGLLASLTSLEGQVRALSDTTGQSDTSLTGMALTVEDLRGVLGNLNGALIDSTGGLKDAMLSISDELEDRLRQSIVSIDQHTKRMSESVTVAVSQGTA
jgi:hypothetical protein